MTKNENYELIQDEDICIQYEWFKQRSYEEKYAIMTELEFLLKHNQMKVKYLDVSGFKFITQLLTGRRRKGIRQLVNNTNYIHAFIKDLLYYSEQELQQIKKEQLVLAKQNAEMFIMVLNTQLLMINVIDLNKLQCDSELYLAVIKSIEDAEKKFILNLKLEERPSLQDNKSLSDVTPNNANQIIAVKPEIVPSKHNSALLAYKERHQKLKSDESDSNRLSPEQLQEIKSYPEAHVIYNGWIYYIDVDNAYTVEVANKKRTKTKTLLVSKAYAVQEDGTDNHLISGEREVILEYGISIEQKRDFIENTYKESFNSSERRMESRLVPVFSDSYDVIAFKYVWFDHKWGWFTGYYGSEDIKPLPAPQPKRIFRKSI